MGSNTNPKRNEILSANHEDSNINPEWKQEMAKLPKASSSAKRFHQRMKIFTTRTQEMGESLRALTAKNSFSRAMALNPKIDFHLESGETHPEPTVSFLFPSD